MGTTYTKTAAGVEEISHRSRGLPARARTLLILIDGKRSDTELAALVPDFAATVQVLMQAGLVAAAPGAPAAAAAARAPAASPAAAGEGPRSSPRHDFATLRRDAARAVNDLLGPEGDALAVRIERAGEAEVLLVALERSISYIADTRGRRAAEDFEQRYLAPLRG